MYYVIYKITNKINNKIYIGAHQTTDLDDSYMGSGKYLTRAIAKHGVQNFTREILFMYDNPIDMFAKEAELVNDDFLSEENTYNLKVGGYGGWDLPRSFRSEELKTELGRRAREGLRRRFDEHGGKRWYYSPCFTGKTHTPGSNAKRKETMKQIEHSVGVKNSQFGTMWITDGLKNSKIKKTALIPEGWRKGRV